MPRELVSGPDLGGGYLHQLSFDQEEGRATFTFHAQEGGLDAGGPPLGSLLPLGFRATDRPCQFGGPRCLHRSFGLASSESARVRAAYNRSRFVLAAELDQLYRGAEVPVAAALSEVVRRAARPLRDRGIDWQVRGEAARWLAGARAVPREVELATTREGVIALGELLTDYLTEPVSLTEWTLGRPAWAARAFVGTLRAGARVGWIEREDRDAEGTPRSAGFGAARERGMQTVPWEGESLDVRSDMTGREDLEPRARSRSGAR